MSLCGSRQRSMAWSWVSGDRWRFIVQMKKLVGRGFVQMGIDLMMVLMEIGRLLCPASDDDFSSPQSWNPEYFPVHQLMLPLSCFFLQPWYSTFTSSLFWFLVHHSLSSLITCSTYLALNTALCPAKVMTVFSSLELENIPICHLYCSSCVLQPSYSTFTSSLF